VNFEIQERILKLADKFLPRIVSIRGAESLTRKTWTNERGETEKIEICLSYELMLKQAKMSLTLVLDASTFTAQIIRSWDRTDLIVIAGFTTLARTEGNEYVKIVYPKDYFLRVFEDAKIIRNVSEFKGLLKQLGLKME
jgi:hypothetical protein